MWRLIVLVVALIPSLEAAQNLTQQNCLDQCNGVYDTTCIRKGNTNVFNCRCAIGFYEKADTEMCVDNCDAQWWSWFTTGDCDQVKGAGYCNTTCQFRVRGWTTAFIIILFFAAVLTILFLFPMCITSCTSCLTVKKEQKERKKAKTPENPYATGSFDGNAAVVPVKPAGAQSSGYNYNPYMYYNPYLYTR